MSNDFESRLAEAIERLPRERQPAADLWPGIEARLGAGRGRWTVPAALAAALAAGLALALWFGQAERPDLPGPGVMSAPAVAAAPARDRLLREAALVDESYRAALLTVRSGPERLDRAQRRALEAELDALDGAQSRIRAALAAQPDGQYLVSLLAQTHAMRLDLVNRLAGGSAHLGGDNENGNA